MSSGTFSLSAIGHRSYALENPAAKPHTGLFRAKSRSHLAGAILVHRHGTRHTRSSGYHVNILDWACRRSFLPTSLNQP